MTRKTETLDIEVRFAVDGDEGTFSGYAALFNEVNGHGEIIKRGAFRRTLRDHKTRGTNPGLFWHHDPTQPIGVWTDIVEDERGLKVTGKLVLDTARGRETHALIKAGALNGLSIGFRAKSSTRENGNRVLADVDLIEISPVTLPSAGGARITNFRSQHGHAGSAAAFVESCRKAMRSLRTR